MIKMMNSQTKKIILKIIENIPHPYQGTSLIIGYTTPG